MRRIWSARLSQGSSARRTERLYLGLQGDDTEGDTVELSKTLERVRGLVAKAESLEDMGGQDNLNEATAALRPIR